jgi:enamine deaminase RidA (YjgF/YER057c/UK114 family)
MGADARLKQLGIELPPVPKPLANYVPSVRAGNLLFLAGHGPQKDGQLTFIGKLGRDMTVEQGREAARLVGLNLLASTRDALGSLDRVKRIVKVLGMVNSADGFHQQPQVINGFSDLMVEVFGDAGRHARSAVGMGELPMGIAVEIEMIVEVADGARSAAGTARTRRAAPARRAAARRGTRRRR